MTLASPLLCCLRRGWLRCISLAWACCAGLAGAAELPDCSRRFTLAFHEHGLLYARRTHRGIDKDVADELIRRSGCQVSTSVMPRARIWREIASGRLDFSMSGISNPERERFAGFAWYLFNKYQFLVRRDSGVQSLDDFERQPQLLIGGIRSFRYSSRLNALVDRLTAQGRLIEVADHEQLLGMMKRGRIHAMIVEPFNYSQIESRELAHLTQLLDSGDPAVLHGLIMSKASLSESEQRKWRALIDGMRADGSLLKIMQRYFSAADAKAFVSF